MLDGKVLTAVLASLAAIAAAINGGGVSAEQLESNSISAPGELTFNQVLPDSLSSLGKLLTNPEPENQVEAVFVAEDISEEKLRVKKARVSAANFSSLELGRKSVRSDEAIELYGFTGEVMPARVTEVKGRSKGLYTSGVNISGRTRISRELETRELQVDNVYRSGLNMEEVTGTVRSNSSSTEIKQANSLSIDSFSGSLTVYPYNQTVVLDGRVNRLDAGEFSFGG